jgi:hypothetical protein
MHLIEGGEKEVRRQLEQSLDAFFEFYPRFDLLLRGHLGVGIPPRAELQAAAHPAQVFRGTGRALASTHHAGTSLRMRSASMARLPVPE